MARVLATGQLYSNFKNPLSVTTLSIGELDTTTTILSIDPISTAALTATPIPFFCHHLHSIANATCRDDVRATLHIGAELIWIKISKIFKSKNRCFYLYCTKLKIIHLVKVSQNQQLFWSIKKVKLAIFELFWLHWQSQFFCYSLKNYIYAFWYTIQQKQLSRKSLLDFDIFQY